MLACAAEAVNRANRTDLRNEGAHVATLAINGGNPVRTSPYPSWPQTDDEEYVTAVADVVRSGDWGGFPEPGVHAAAFEAAFAAYQGAQHGVLMMNGTVTMEVACKALGIGWGDEVIVPAPLPRHC